MRFADIPGQEKIKQQLIQSFQENRVSHAQLFLGPEGSGKLAMAIAYAQYINCRNRSPQDSCGTCPACNKFNKLIHPDLHFLYPVNKTKEVDDKKVVSLDFIIPWREFLNENYFYVTLPSWYEKIGIEKKQGFISADDSDSVNHTLAFKAYEADYKVLIIWMVEKMNIPAANKLLKNLEEPPDRTLFILVSEKHEQVISTILSRTQLVKFPRLEDKWISSSLAQRYNLDQQTIDSITLLAEGNLRFAFDLAEASGKDLPESDTEKEHFKLLRDWMRKIYIYGVGLKEYGQLQESVASLVGEGSREKQKDFLTYCLKILRLCLHYHIGNTQLVKYRGEQQEFIAKFSTFIHPGNIGMMEKEFNKAIQHIERNANASLVFTDLSLIIAGLIKIPPSSQPKKM